VFDIDVGALLNRSKASITITLRSGLPLGRYREFGATSKSFADESSGNMVHVVNFAYVRQHCSFRISNKERFHLYLLFRLL